MPAALVKLVLTFAAERPSLLQALEGRAAELPSLGHWWEESWHGERQVSQSPQPDAASHVQAERLALAVAERPPAGAAPSSSNDVQAQPDMEKESGPDQDTNDLLTALRNSKSDMPPLSPEGHASMTSSSMRRAHWLSSTCECWKRVARCGCHTMTCQFALHHRINDIICTSDGCSLYRFVLQVCAWMFVHYPLRAGRAEMVAGEGFVYSRDGGADAGAASLRQPLSSGNKTI